MTFHHTLNALLRYLVKYAFNKSSCSRTAWTNYHACKIQWLKIVVKNRPTLLIMWAICNSLTRKYLPSNSQNNWLYAPAATKKKDSIACSFSIIPLLYCLLCYHLWWNKGFQNPFAHHQHSVAVSDDVSLQVIIGLHHFDYLRQVKINVKTLNNSHTQDIWRFLHLSAGQCPDTQSAWDNQLSCL